MWGLCKEVMDMAKCGIMRIEKRRRAAVYGIQIEANRTKEDHDKGRDFDRSDIDWKKTNENIHLIKTEKWNNKITKALHKAGVKERKDSVVLIDGLYTASPDFFEGKPLWKIKSYFQDCLNFHIREFCQNDKKRVINAVIHFDEKTPHMAVASIPFVIDEKGLHLSAKLLMGNRSEYRLRQDRFFEQVSQKYNLERGEAKDPTETKAHLTKREWQSATIEEELADLKLQYHNLVKKFNSLVDQAMELKKSNIKCATDILQKEEMYQERSR